MRELSLHLLDVMENALRAGARVLLPVLIVLALLVGDACEDVSIVRDVGGLGEAMVDVVLGDLVALGAHQQL